MSFSPGPTRIRTESSSNPSVGPLCHRWPGRRSAAGISWVVLNRNVDYIAEIRKSHRVPIFGVSSDHEEIGRIQGHQFAALLPKGGTVLHIQGPSESLAAKQRTTGMYETKPADVQVKVMRAQWTETSSYRAVSSWLRLSTSHQTRIDLIAAQDDGMALGATKSLPGTARHRGPATLAESALHRMRRAAQDRPGLGQAGTAGRNHLCRPKHRQALEMLVKALQTGTMPPESTLTRPVSIPALDVLAPASGEVALAVGLVPSSPSFP